VSQLVAFAGSVGAATGSVARAEPEAEAGEGAGAGAGGVFFLEPKIENKLIPTKKYQIAFYDIGRRASFVILMQALASWRYHQVNHAKKAAFDLLLTLFRTP
jgi:hypothetical protein